MSLSWIHENPPRWDAGKATIIGGSDEGIFRRPQWSDGDVIPGEWWRVEHDGKTVGYGWMEIDWVEAEVLLAVAPDARKRGVGSFIVEKLVDEASERGVNYLANVVRETHPQRDAVSEWLRARGFAHIHDDDRLVRQIRATGGLSATT